MLGGIAAIVIVVYILLGISVDLLVPRISPDMEARFSGYFSSMRPVGDVKNGESGALQGLADKIQAQCVDLPYQLDVEVVDNDMVNALALPGGNIVIFSGLLDAAGSENELAFVLAHEMGHFVNRDHLTGLGRGLVLMTMSAALFGGDSVIGQRLGYLMQVSELGFSRQHESGADAYALATMNCYYGHVAGSTSFFEHTADMEQGRFAGHYLSSHPLHEQRVASLKTRAAEQEFRVVGGLNPVGPFKPASKESRAEIKQTKGSISENN